MHRPLVSALLACTLAGPMARADSPPFAAEPANRAWALADAVLARHVEPPARQQMILAGLKAVAKAGNEPTTPGLARRVSDLAGAEQLAALLAETWPGSKIIDREGRESFFFGGMLSAVPGEATLLSAKERKVAEQIEGNVYVGIQVALSIDEASHRPTFNQVLKGGPADNAGARDGDVIEAIDGVSTEGRSMLDVIDRLRGEEGTIVEVTFRRAKSDEVITKPMTRGRLPRTTVEGAGSLPGKRWKVLLDGPLPIGYLKITEISGSTPQELRGFAEQFESEGLKALVLDLRGVRSAGFHPTVLLADALLDGGAIGVVKSADSERAYRAEPDALFRGLPMVVVADGPLPPEAAWLVDALRDNHRASVVGKVALGGSPVVEETVALPGGEWSVRMTTGRLARGDGSPLSAMETKNSRGERFVRETVRTFLAD